MGSRSSEAWMAPTQVTDDDGEIISFAIQLTGAAELPMVLKTALELSLFEIMAKAGPGTRLSPPEIASQLPTQNPDTPTMLDRILCFLASYFIVTGLAPACKFFTKNKDGVSMAPLCLMNHDKVFDGKLVTDFNFSAVS
ncbi:hypothetical protein NL676_000417 [Syzygium grande]|nr:hypothetical protein NL676_000417 [Syzygium grande]